MTFSSFEAIPPRRHRGALGPTLLPMARESGGPEARSPAPRCLAMALPAIVDVGQVAVVGGAQKGDPIGQMVAAVAKRVPVMELEKACARCASTTLPVHVAASPAIALVHDGVGPRPGAWREDGDVSLVGRGLLPRGVRLREAPGFEPLWSFSVTACSMIAAEVAVGHRGAHQRP